jgi:hypothetical protein
MTILMCEQVTLARAAMHIAAYIASVSCSCSLIITKVATAEQLDVMKSQE